METEKRKGTYTGKKKGKGTRWEIYFNEGGEEDRKYSAFEPLLNLEQIKEGREYSYEVVHVPTKDDPSKFHHNLGRVGKDMDFAIEWTGEEGKPSQKQPSTPKPQPEAPKQEPSKLQKEYDERIAKEKREKAMAEEVKQISITRGGLAHDAAQMVAVLQQTGAIKIRAKTGLSELEAAKETLKVASEYHEILLGHLVENNEIASKKKREQLEMGDLKPQKKEPIEAEV